MLPELISDLQVSYPSHNQNNRLFRIAKLIPFDSVPSVAAKPGLLFIKLMLLARKITPHTDSDVKLAPPAHISDINIHDANLYKLNFYSVKFPTPPGQDRRRISFAPSSFEY